MRNKFEIYLRLEFRIRLINYLSLIIQRANLKRDFSVIALVVHFVDSILLGKHVTI